MKKLCILFLSFLICLCVSGCSNNSDNEQKTVELEQQVDNNLNESENEEHTEPVESEQQEDDEPETNISLGPMEESEIRDMYSDADKYSDRPIELEGYVFTTPEYAEGLVAFQIYADIKNMGRNTVIAVYDSNFEIESGAYIKVSGTVLGSMETENVLGAKMVLPVVRAESVEFMTYQEAVSPALHTIEIDNCSQTQYGYTVTIEKIELAKEETRIYVKVENNGSDEFNLYSFNAKIIQNGRQFEEQTNYDANYPEVQSNLSVGVTTEGIITFPPVEKENLKIILPAYSDNFSENISDYIFEIIIEDSTKGDEQ